MKRNIRTILLAWLAMWQCLALISANQDKTPLAYQANRKATTEQQVATVAEDDLNHRNKLAERLFKFRDARVHVSATGRYLWVTKTGENPDRPAEVWILELAEDFSKLEARHHFKLLNPVSPTGECMTSDGKYFVTLDEAGRCGNSPRDLVIYDLDQGTSLARSIDEFLPEPVVKSLKGPVYMGGKGLRQWQKLGAGLNKYDATTQTLYPTKPRLANTTSKVPFLSIHLPSGKVQVEPVPEDDSSKPESLGHGLLPQYVQTDWAMADGTRKIPAGSDDPVTLIGIFQPRVPNKNDKQLRLAFKRDSKTGDYLPMDWDEFMKQSNSRFNMIEPKD